MCAPSCDRVPPLALPFLHPGRERHRVAICRGDTCPRCGSNDVGPWGGFSGRRRFRCRGCGRTFSTFTGTPLYYLKRVDRWLGFLECIDDRASIRASGERLDVHPATAFRWRHRLLEDWRRRDRTRLAGRVHLDVMPMAYNRKGCRRATSPPRTRRYLYPSRIPERLRVNVALLWEDDRSTLARVSAAGTPPVAWIERALPPLLGDVSELVTDLVPSRDMERRFAPVAVFPLGRDPGPARPRHLALPRRLRRWLRPFRGVATKYLDRYLQWFRSDLERAAQQFPRTAAECPGDATMSVRASARFVIHKTMHFKRLRPLEPTRKGP